MLERWWIGFGLGLASGEIEMELISGIVMGTLVGIALMAGWSRVMRHRSTKRVVKLNTIWAETADNARSAARSFILGGLSEKYHGLSDFWVADHINEIDLEAHRILNNCYERAKEILQRNRKLMDSVVDHLVEKKSLTKKEFFQLVEEHGHLELMPQNIINIRNTKWMQFQEMMMAQKGSA